MSADVLPLLPPTSASQEAIDKASPGCRFDLALEATAYCTPAAGDYWCIHSADTFFGYFVLDRVRLAPLTLDDSVLHTRHLRCISTTQDFRGIGLWSMVLTKMIELADQHGVFLHAVSFPFQMLMPLIANGEDFLAFIQNESDYFMPILSWKKQKKASQDLLKKYLTVGFRRFRYPSGNNFINRWTRNNLGFAYLPDALEPGIRQTLSPYMKVVQREDQRREGVKADSL